MEKEALKHYMLVSYTLKFLAQKDKVRVLRELKGYKEKKHGKVYEHQGLLHKLKAEKLSGNVLLVPMNNFTEIQNFFSKDNVKTEVKEAWLN